MVLLAPTHDAFPLLCVKCGGEMRVIAFISEAMAVHDIHAYLGEPTSTPGLMPARAPPL